MLMKLRGIVSLVFILVYTFICFWIVTAPLIVSPSGRISQWLVRKVWAAGMLAFCGVKVIPEGQENIKVGMPCIFISNHQSHFDILTIFHTNPINLRFLAKRSLFNIPILGYYLWLAGYIPVDRSNRESAIHSLDRAAKKIRNGIPIVAFAEGTRSLSNELLPFKKGPFMLALKAGAPVIPISISGTLSVLPKTSLLPRPGLVRIHYGAPIDLMEYTTDDRDRLMDEVRQIITRNKAKIEVRPT
jgi:1-acyl-sn-glycerol-3-phosphate acyltransferase